MNERTKTIGLFGGTFDPIHNGHVKAAEDVQRVFSFDRILFIPSYIPPHKESEDVATAEHRLKMVELAVSSFDKFFPSSIEIDAEGMSYSIVTLNRIKEMFPQTEVFFLLGVDAFLDIKTWKDYEAVLEQCSFVVMSRPGFQLEEAKNTLPEKYNRRMGEVSGSIQEEKDGPPVHTIYLLSITPVDVSSTEIRERVRRNQSIAGLVPENVENYIKEKRLYL